MSTLFWHHYLNRLSDYLKQGSRRRTTQLPVGSQGVDAWLWLLSEGFSTSPCKHPRKSFMTQLLSPALDHVAAGSILLLGAQYRKNLYYWEIRFCSEWQVLLDYDIWRYQHSNEWDYTYYSSPRVIDSRIDFFLIDNQSLLATQKTEIGLNTWSDHSLIFFFFYISRLLVTWPRDLYGDSIISY